MTCLKISSFFILGMFCCSNPTAAQHKEIIGYFPSWKRGPAAVVITPEKIPYAKLTMLNYAFWYPFPDGSIAGKDSVGDGLFLERNEGTPSIVDRAHRTNVKVLLSIGGWSDSDNFPAVAADQTCREQFAHSCIQAIRSYGFDGIDIDWEYPGYADHKGSPVDRTNFTLLLKVTRDSLNAYGNLHGKKMLLTAALPSSPELLVYYDMKNVETQLDMFNIMTYDYYGSWGPFSGHNAPLYAYDGNDTIHNIDATFKFYTRQLNITPSKINIGIPFYGHAYARCTMLNSRHGGGDTTLFSRQGAFYNGIIKYADMTNRTWDMKAKVPYLVLNKEKILVSYDDEESVSLKAQYVNEHDAGGVIIWEITGDLLENGTTPLLDKIYGTLSSRPVLK